MRNTHRSKQFALWCLAALAPACFGGAISVNGTCGQGNCATPDTLSIGGSTSINSSFVYTFANGDMYQVSTFFPVSNPNGFMGIGPSSIISATYLGNGSGGVSAQDVLSINLLQNLQSPITTGSETAGGYPIFGVLGGGIASGSSLATQYSEGPIVSPVLGPLVGPGDVSAVQANFSISGTTTNPMLWDGVVTDTFQAGSAIGSFIDSAFEQPVAFNNLPGGPSSTPVVLLGGTLVGGLTGTIAGSGSQEYYTFHWAGGAFSATASITGSTNSGASYLFSDGVAGTCSSLASATLNGGDSFSATISTPNLAPGAYCIGMDANNSNDPTFAITFNTPVEGVPEPATIGMTLLGLTAYCLAPRRRRMIAPATPSTGGAPEPR
jgi:hypothetical protein